MQDQSLTERVERQLADSGMEVVAEVADGVLLLSGIVDTEEARQAAEDLAAGIVGGELRIDNSLEVATLLPSDVDDFVGEEPSADTPETVEDALADGGEITPDFTDQTLLTDPLAAVGPSSSYEDPVQTGDEVYFPPTDPVVTTDVHGNTHILGGFAPTSMADQEVEPSAEDDLPGDEALADAIRRELREDAATTDLRVHVVVRRGVAHLRGRVPAPEDAENAEDVASRVPGVQEVLEELDVGAL